jgi:uncharacterized protein with PIN domain
VTSVRQAAEDFRHDPELPADESEPIRVWARVTATLVMNQLTFRFYGPLNDFLPVERRQVAFEMSFGGRRSVKDAIESVGVPHPEVDLILLNGEPAPFAAPARSGDRIAAFPSFYSIDISSIGHVRPRSLETVRFVLDGHLGKLARHLRLLGLDAVCPAGADDDALAGTAAREARILLTRDRELLKRRTVTHGYFVRESHARRQIVEVLQRYGSLVVKPFSRCLRCNGELHRIAKAAIESVLPTGTREHYEDFQMCGDCGRVYWQGSHWPRLKGVVDAALRESGGQVPF